MHSIDNAIYDRIPDSWWSDDSFMALLRNAVNPARFEYFRAVLARRGGVGLTMLDIGCGGGLLAERFAALGCKVTGIDLSEPTLATAREHALQGGFDVHYLQGDAQALPFAPASFDVVCCCDVLEHVNDVDRVLTGIARVLKSDGVFFFDTINRTLRSKLLAIHLAQDCALTRVVPRDVHVWEQFIRPHELEAGMQRCGLAAQEFAGLSPAMNPLKAGMAFLKLKLGRGSFGELGNAMRMRRSSNLSLSYMGYATSA